MPKAMLPLPLDMLRECIERRSLNKALRLRTLKRERYGSERSDFVQQHVYAVRGLCSLFKEILRRYDELDPPE